jgi:hypothetical protein
MKRGNMNIKILSSKLKEENIDPRCYALNMEYPNEAYTINNNHGTWEVYYSERGNKNSIEYFDTEADACNYLYKLVKEFKGE